eukprot:scaffold80781_cov75-Phaeocystis_antarctica.AAC.1
MPPCRASGKRHIHVCSPACYGARVRRTLTQTAVAEPPRRRPRCAARPDRHSGLSGPPSMGLVCVLALGGGRLLQRAAVPQRRHLVGLGLGLGSGLGLGTGLGIGLGLGLGSEGLGFGFGLGFGLHLPSPRCGAPTLITND